MKQTRGNLRIVGGSVRQAAGSKNLGANVTERAPQRQAPRQTHSLLVTDRWVGARATNVLVTDRERGWRAPSGKRANGKPNTYLRTALKAGQDRSGYVTAPNVTRSAGSDAVSRPCVVCGESITVKVPQVRVPTFDGKVRHARCTL